MKNKINIDNRRMGLIVLIVIAMVFLLTIILYLFHFRSLSSLEKKSLTEKNNEIIYYLNYLDNEASSIEKGIVFALIYNAKNNNRNKLSSAEIVDYINSNFNIDVSTDDLKSIGITPYMLENNVEYEPGNDTYKILFNNIDAKTISEQKIAYYKQTKMSKVNRKKYKITYEKYIIDNPYDVLNYYMDQNINRDEKELKNLTDIKNYLMGMGDLVSFKKSIDEEDIKIFGKYDKKISINFVDKKGEIVIDKVK